MVKPSHVSGKRKTKNKPIILGLLLHVETNAAKPKTILACRHEPSHRATQGVAFWAESSS